MDIINNMLNSDKKYLHKIEKEALKVDALKEEYAKLTDDELRDKTKYFKEQLKNGKTLDDIKIEAFATVREAAKRVLNEFPFVSQVEGALVLHNGDIAEMNTGSGKTLASTLAIYLNALSNDGVHVITANEYLAERDSNWMGGIYRFLDLSVGLNTRNANIASKQEAYNCDITYTTASELGFDYLRDNMVVRPEERVLRGLNFAVIDEADSILIDEAKVPLVISGQSKEDESCYLQANTFVNTLSTSDYVIDLEKRKISLSEEGILKAESFFNLKNLYTSENSEIVHCIFQALKANFLFHKNCEYMVENDEIVIINQNTGRKNIGREWSDGLHQAIQAKEGISIKNEAATVATITYQNFFRLYKKLAGMTGTAKTEEEELLEIYNMRVLVIPPNKPVIRDDKPDLIFATKKAKYKALIEEVKKIHEQGRPVLLGTIAIETSEVISDLLTQNKIPHEVLNAKNHAREAEIIALAGQKGQVTIATNMAGRGTDIKLGEGVTELGGLCVLGSERHESRRIDNQLRGRSGRQGDPGMSQFYVSLEDDLMIKLDSKYLTKLAKIIKKNKINNISFPKTISRIQKRIEENNYDTRKLLMKYDEVIAKQRSLLYKERNSVLVCDNTRIIVDKMYKRAMNVIMDSYLANFDSGDNINISKLQEILRLYNYKIEDYDIFDKMSINDIKHFLSNEMFKEYETRVEAVYESAIKIEKYIILKNIDKEWALHINKMEKLKDNIAIRSIARIDPLQAYEEEGHSMFNNMIDSIALDVVAFTSNMLKDCDYPDIE